MPDQPYPHRWKALAVLALSLLIVTVDNTILNVALPTIRSDLDASSSDLQWIVDSYLLVFAGLLLAAGSLGDRFGRKKALFRHVDLRARIAAGGALRRRDRADRLSCADGRRRGGDHADDPLDPHEHLSRGRAPQGDRDVGGGVRARDRLGPITGGWLLEHFAWSSMFLVNLPSWRLPDRRRGADPRVARPRAAAPRRAGRRPLDRGPDDVVWALIEAPERGWTSPTIVGAFAGGAAILGAFVAWERRTPQPMLDVTCSATCASARRACR